jgi:hypothetical protein
VALRGRQQQELEHTIADLRADGWRRVRRTSALAFAVLGVIATTALLVSVWLVLARPHPGIYLVGIPALVLGAVIPSLTVAASPAGLRPRRATEPDDPGFVCLSLLLPPLCTVSIGIWLLVLGRVFVAALHRASLSTPAPRMFLACLLVGVAVSMWWLPRTVEAVSGTSVARR